MSITIADLTKEEIIRIATNYVLTVSRGQVLKITRFQINEYGVAIVNVRCVNKEGEKFTIQVIVANEVVSGLGGLYERTDEMLTADKVNPDFGIVEEGKVTLTPEQKAEAKAKAAQEKAEAKAKKEFEEFVGNVQGNVNYANNRKRHRNSGSVMAGAKRSIKRHGVEKLESIMNLLDEPAQLFVQNCINELLATTEAEETMKGILNRTTKFSPVLEGVLDQIEATLKGFEEQVYTNILRWMKHDDYYSDFTQEALEREATDYVANQRVRLMYAAVRYLGGLDIVSVANSSIRNHHNGFEGTWRLNMADGSTKVFRTNTIIAEGYVQRAHYRYLVHLS